MEPETAQAEFQPQASALRFMRRVRWLGAVFAVVQFVLYEPPVGISVPFDQVATGLLFGTLIVAVNLVLLAAERRLGATLPLVLVALIVDAAVVVAVVWLFRFDATSALWGLLVIPVLEAAIAAQMLGALAMWGALTVMYLIREYDTAQRYAGFSFEIPSVTFRMGIVLIVAATAGSLARSLTQEARAQRTAREESQQRARLLHGLALSSQSLLNVRAQTDPQAVWEVIVSAAVEVGFKGASVMVADPDRGHFTVAYGDGVPDDYIGSRETLDTGMAGAVWASGEAVVVTDYSSWDGAAPALEGEQYGATIAVPIRRAFDVEAVLVAAYPLPGDIPRPERECIELLGLHAGVALNNVAHFVERARYEAQLTAIAYSDTLTGLPNRDLFVERLDEALADDEYSVAVLFIDLDRFKTVNDSLGHQGGDVLLVELARRLVDAARPHLVARFGGDEFTVLVSGVTGPEGARGVAEDLTASLSTPVFIDGHEILPSISVGIRCAQRGERDGHLLLRDADTAMYRAKALGRQRVEVFDPRLATGLPALTLEGELRRALERHEFMLHYQPVISIADGQIRSVEALLRWNHPTRGVIPPADFIPIAEDSGLITPLGRWVLHEACRQTVAWHRAGHPLDVAVNVSLIQLHDLGLVGDIEDALTSSGIPAANLLLEITESATVIDPVLMLEQALRLRALGARLALDDFGQGTTSLRYLRRLPLDVLKIDKSFVDDLVAAPDDVADQAAVVRSVIAMAHDLGLTVTAEGVEEPRQLALLRGLGCDQAQGFLLGRPVPPAELEDMIRTPQDLQRLTV